MVNMLTSVLMLSSFTYPPSSFLTGMSLLTAAALANGGLSEIRGKNIQYSKFWNVGSDLKSTSKKQLSVKTGMLIAYTPAFLFSLASFALFPNECFRFILVKLAMTLHFFKRILEVLVVHKYSSALFFDVAITISLSYFINTAIVIYAQHRTLGLPEPSIDLTYAGVVMFLTGLTGNLYHHYLLSKLRDGGVKEYRIPKGGLFDLVICPHYLFEIIGFVGVSCIAQTLFAFSFAIGTTVLLVGRSYATRKWYLSKFEDFPKHVKALIPFMF